MSFKKIKDYFILFLGFLERNEKKFILPKELMIEIGFFFENL